jgi:Tfp pilus assembly protein PilN
MAPGMKAIEKDMARIKMIKDYLSDQGQVLNVLAEIYDIVPQNTYFSDIRIIERGRFSIKGFSDSMSSVFTFIGIMEESKYFENVVAKYTSKRKEDDKDVAIFEITGDVKKVRSN